MHAYREKNKWHNLRHWSVGLKILAFFCCRYTKFERDQRSQISRDILHKLFFAMDVLERCLPYVKSYFQSHQWSFYFLIPILESSRVRVFKKEDFRKHFSAERFKSVFVLRKKRFSFFRPQNTQTFSFFASAGLKKIKDQNFGTQEF